MGEGKNITPFPILAEFYKADSGSWLLRTQAEWIGRKTVGIQEHQNSAMLQTFFKELYVKP